jgi:hypothetical protein
VIVRYTEMPDEVGGGTRPLLDLTVADMEEMSLPCLADSGALNTLLPAWLARAAGLSLRGAKIRDIAVAAVATRAVFVTTPLAAAGHRWEAEAGFCDPWP